MESLATAAHDSRGFGLCTEDYILPSLDLFVLYKHILIILTNKYFDS